MRAPGGFTESVRQELAQVALGAPEEIRAELVTVVALAGDAEGVIATASGPLARRTHRLVSALTGASPEVTVAAPSGRPRRPTYRVRVPASLLIAHGSGAGQDEPVGVAAARWRAALLATGSLSAPGRSPHLEVVVRDAALAHRLVTDLSRAVPGGHASHDPARQRLVVKSGGTVGDLLARTGASAAFLAFDERRLRRQLRDDAMRATNADAANLRRSAEAAAMRIDVIEGLVERIGWEGIPEPLRAVALARLANPEASLAGLAELLGVGRSTVHRRLRALEVRAAEEAEGPAGSVMVERDVGGRGLPDPTITVHDTVRDDRGPQ